MVQTEQGPVGHQQGPAIPGPEQDKGSCIEERPGSPGSSSSSSDSTKGKQLVTDSSLGCH